MFLSVQVDCMPLIPTQAQIPSPSPQLSRGMVLLMAFTTGVVVAGNYYAQPLLHSISASFDLSYASAGIIVTVAQLSYALGLVLLVPLGDLFEQRRLMVTLLLLSTSGLFISALSQNFWMLLLGTSISSFFSVVAQVIVPFGAALASPSQRGEVVGTIMSGLLLGILLARTVSGMLSDLGDWHTIYWCIWFVSVSMGVSALCLGRRIDCRFYAEYTGANSMVRHAQVSSRKYLEFVYSLLINLCV